jgi:hypothetical protein
LCGHFEVHKEVFAILLAHWRNEQGRGQTKSQCENRPTSEHIRLERFHRE